MLTPQEVSGHAFTKAVMGGYNMAMVDEFLDELTDDYTALYKENAALKAKMKVLVEKVEDYRATEDSMRATLLTAQKMADSIVREAEDKREQLLREAQAQAQERINAMRREVIDVQERLKEGQQELAGFIQGVRSVCEQQMALLEQLPQRPVEQPAAPAPAVPAAEIEEKILSGFRQEAEPVQEAVEQPPVPPAREEGPVIAPLREVAPARPEAARPAGPQPIPQPPAQPREAERTPEPDYPEGNPFAPETDEPTRKLNLDDLKFGRNYSRED